MVQSITPCQLLLLRVLGLLLLVLLLFLPACHMNASCQIRSAVQQLSLTPWMAWARWWWLGCPADRPCRHAPAATAAAAVACLQDSQLAG